MDGAGRPLADRYRRAAAARRTEGLALRDSGHPIDMHRLRAFRLGRLRAEMRRRDLAACVLFHPNAIRYATGSRNMTIYALHYPTRYVFVPLEGPLVLFDYFGSEHLAEALETIDEVRPAVVWDFYSAAEHVERRVQAFAAEIADLLRKHGGGSRRLGLDQLELQACHALQGLGVETLSAQPALELARAVKSPDEILGMSHAMAVCEAGVARMAAALEPGMSEQALWSILHQTNIELGGEHIETRLLNSGARTNPWYQECSDRIIRAGDLVAFDTDLIGPLGFGCDMSRTVICGDRRPSDEQKRLYRLAYENVQRNIELLRPGLSFREYVDKSWDLPAEFVPRRYAKIAHGIGVGFEYPYIPYKNDWADYGYEGVIEEGMTLCIESYIGSERTIEGVKLEEQVVVTANGAELISSYPVDERLLG
jgi:Xaa-Pro aminopeptidase